MNLTLSELQKLSIKAALNKNWKEAIELNLQILSQDENNLDARLRLGVAYLQLEDFKNAKKYYSQVLEMDPINKIALEKMKFVKEKKIQEFVVPDTERLLKEPGNSIELTLEILTKGITSEKFKFGDNLILKVKDKTVSIHRDGERQSLINYLSEAVSKAILKSISKKGDLDIKFIGGKEKKIKIIITSSISVFPSEKQDIRPYVKSSDDSDTPEMNEVINDNDEKIKETEDQYHSEEEDAPADKEE
ncbi:MAG: tetratricopeptide repeat protein [Proteobacteria bacterium]|nr:tetratricopeptide repeat protein [Pseudomonadota bacterium]